MNRPISNKQNMFAKSPVVRLWQTTYERFVRIRGEPREIAFGFALGIFMGMSPFLGIQMALALFFAALFKWNKISAMLGCWISNPVTMPVIYPVTYLVGAKLVGNEKAYPIPDQMDWTLLMRMLEKSPEIISLMTLGGIILGIPLAVTGYVFAFSAVKRYQDEIKRKLEAVKAKRKQRKKRSERKKRHREGGRMESSGGKMKHTRTYVTWYLITACFIVLSCPSTQ